MHTDDTGVTDLLRRASDDLTPDVDRLVSGAVTRGRSRQRRARIGAAIASFGVIGVGTLVAVMPWLDGGADTARDPGIATDEPTDEATTSGDSAGGPTIRDIPAAEIPDVALTLVAADPTPSVSAVDVHLDDPGRKVVRARYDGMTTEFGVRRGDPPSLAGCRRDARGVDGICEELPDGAVLLRWGPSLTDGVTCHGAALERGGYQLWATSCNASTRDAPPLAPEPPLSLDQLAQVLVADYWFE